MKLILITIDPEGTHTHDTVIEFPDRLSCLHTYGILCEIARIKKEAAEEACKKDHLQEYEHDQIEGGI